MASGGLHSSQLVFFSVSAAAPMTVIAGGVVTTLSVTGNRGVPLGLAIVAVALLVFVVGYNAMSRRVHNSGAFSAYLAHGFGPKWGVSGRYVALTTYSAMQISLYGLFGYVASLGARENLGIDLSWWVWSFIAMALIGVIGLFEVSTNAKLIAILLSFEVLAIVLFDVAAFAHPSGGSVGMTGLSLSSLIGPGIGGVFAFSIAAFIGFESSPFYAEEAEHPGKSVARATYWSLGITGVIYVVSSFALIVRAGPDNIVALARDPDANMPFSFMQSDIGETVAVVASIFLVTSVIAGLSSFHNNVARYVFAAGRDGIIPGAQLLGRTARNGAPVGGSLTQSAIALVAVSAFALLGLDPLTQLFAWLSYVAAVGFLLLMIASSLAIASYFRSNAIDESKWERRTAPIAAALLLGLVAIVTVANASAMLGEGATATAAYVLPGVVVVSGVAGYVMGEVMRRTRPEVYALIGRHGRS
jgi:amino acid transporter